MNDLWLELLKSSPAAAVMGFVVWWTMRDHGKILRSIDLRLARVLEHVRMTPPFGVPRAPSVHEIGAEPSVPRTITDDDITPSERRRR